MKRLFVLALVGSAACGRDPKVPQQLLEAGVTAAPDVITNPAAVVFWLRDVDTLAGDSAVVAVQDLTSMSQDLVDLLSDTDVEVYFTTRSRIYVRAQLSPRRVVTLNGLDFPWGVVFVEPGYAEQIVTGPVPPADFREMVYDYFGLDDEKPSGPIAMDPNAWLGLVARRASEQTNADDADGTQICADDSVLRRTLLIRRRSRLRFL
jgi:hypothetical protein